MSQAYYEQIAKAEEWESCYPDETAPLKATLHCPYCGKELPDNHTPCCGEIGHGTTEEER